MNKRSIGGLALAAVLALAACAPTQQGADETTEPVRAASPEQSMEMDHSMEMPSPASGDDSGGGDPDDYDY
jgi:hypothetical protein